MGEAVSKVADPVDCCGSRKPDIKDGPSATGKKKSKAAANGDGGGGGGGLFSGMDELLGKKATLEAGQLVISDACYKGNLDEVMTPGYVI